jgi:methylated-DNA-[protein]-cysteine S-methyltransferase
MNDPQTLVERRLQTTVPSSPPMRPPTFDSADVSYVVEDTAVGRILFARNAIGALVASRYVADDEAVDTVLDRIARSVSPRVLRRPGDLDDARYQFDDFLAGRRHEFDLVTDLVLATPFQRDVLGTLAQTVGYGERATYGGLARAIDRPTASRAVGAALGANPLCIVVPCHRVVGSHGAMTGYAGGVRAKEYLLALEQSAA